MRSSIRYVTFDLESENYILLEDIFQGHAFILPDRKKSCWRAFYETTNHYTDLFWYKLDVSERKSHLCECSFRSYSMCPGRNHQFPKHVLGKSDSDDDEDGGRDGQHGPIFIHFLGETFVYHFWCGNKTRHVSEQIFKENRVKYLDRVVERFWQRSQPNT